MKKYNHKKIEKKVQEYWKKNKTFKTKINIKKKKFYCLSMIPYPSGYLHMGHVRNYTIGDIIARYQRLNNKNVLHPIGWDAFGLPAENAAIKNNTSPKKWTKKNIKYMKKQLKKLGISYDWDREINTCKSNFYKWEQWLFIKLFKKKLIYKKKEIVNWCPKDKTVLANEQVINKKCWRCNTTIIEKKISQWFIKITKYANKLYKDINKLKKWPEQVKNMQKKWIGKNKGTEITFNIKDINKKIKIFTKKIKFLIYTECISISKNNKIIKFIEKKNKKTLNYYKKKIDKKNDKYIGIYTKLYTINPITKKKIYIWITNLTNDLYNTEEILITPKYYKSHYNFIKKNKIKKKKITKIEINNIKKKKYKIIKNLFKKKILKKKINFKIKDWVISRQRYWGVPIPIIYINKKYKTIKENELPLKLPKIKNKNFSTNFLKKNLKWKNININNKIKRETDTLDTFFESSWYYMRYTSPEYKKNIFNYKETNYWLPINIYIGGIEHATMHLIYFRFMHKFFKNIGLTKFNEPVKKLICQGIVVSDAYYYKKNNNKIWIPIKMVKKIKKNKKTYFYYKKNNIKLKLAGKIKMSKSKNNGINPKNIIKKYGADTIRLFIIFAAPIEKKLYWNESGIKGCYRFIKKIWNLVINFEKIILIKKNKNIKIDSLDKIKFLLNKTIKDVTYDINRKNNFNTAIAKIMKFTNIISNYKIKNKKEKNTIKKCIKKTIILLYPFIPHISFYLWNKLDNKKIIDNISWPKIYKNNENINFKIKIAIQLNGKTKKIIEIKNNINKKEILKTIYNNKKINNILNKKNKIKKIIYIKNKIINFVTNK